MTVIWELIERRSRATGPKEAAIIIEVAMHQTAEVLQSSSFSVGLLCYYGCSFGLEWASMRCKDHKGITGVPRQCAPVTATGSP